MLGRFFPHGLRRTGLTVEKAADEVPVGLRILRPPRKRAMRFRRPEGVSTLAEKVSEALDAPDRAARRCRMQPSQTILPVSLRAIKPSDRRTDYLQSLIGCL